MKLSYAEKAQIEHWLKSFTKLSNDFDKEDNKPLMEYWKGQVMGILKVTDLIGKEIHSSHYLSQLP
jgi:hypothetical protein